MITGPGIPANGSEPAATAANPHNSIDTTRPHPARRYDALLGGKDNFAADRASAERLAAAFPTIRAAAIENRRFLQRVVAFLAGEAGIRQFLDIGAGIPTRPNVHEVAQAIAAESRIVYVDNDPLVMTHARALMTSSPEGATGYVQADLRDPEAILADPVLHNSLDLRMPVGLLFIAERAFPRRSRQPYGNVARLVEALPSGSYVALSHVTFDGLPADTVERLNAQTAPDAGHGPFRARKRDEVVRFPRTTAAVDPGLVSIVDWRPTQQPQPEASAADTAFYGAVGRTTMTTSPISRAGLSISRPAREHEQCDVRRTVCGSLA